MSDKTRDDAAAQQAADQQDAEVSDEMLDDVAGGAHTTGSIGATPSGKQADGQSGGTKTQGRRHRGP